MSRSLKKAPYVEQKLFGRVWVNEKNEKYVSYYGQGLQETNMKKKKLLKFYLINASKVF